jgi:hypothetical protein
MMIRYLVVLLLLVGCATSRSQGVNGVVDFFLDPVGRAYYLLADDRLVTANPLGGNTYSYYDSSLGSPDYVDVTNPFQILIYYREYGKVIVLDRTLNELDRIDLFAKRSIQQPGAIARSYDNGIWVFDNWNYRLLRLDDRGEVDQQTNDLRLELGNPGEPADIFVGRATVMLHFPEESRLAVFTNYGEFQGWVSLPEESRISWNAPRLLGVRGEEAWVWEVGQPAIRELGQLPDGLRGGQQIRLGAIGYLDVADPAAGVRMTEIPVRN